jgi:hypothetical protein
MVVIMYLVYAYLLIHSLFAVYSGRLVLNEDAGIFTEAKRLKKSNTGETKNEGIPRAVFLWQTFQGNQQVNALIASILI